MKRNFFAATVILTLAVASLGVGSAYAQDEDPAQVEAGMAVFESNCVGCHSADGTGSDTGRDLTGVATEADRSVHIMSVTEGKGNMPAFGENLSADEIDAAVSYVRATFVAQELAVTGSESRWLVLGAITLLGAGLMLVGFGRRETALG